MKRRVADSSSHSPDGAALEIARLAERWRRTERQRRGAQAESLAAEMLRALGWWIEASNLRIGRDEIDLLAVDPGPPPALVCVEVRSATSARFGTPEERIDRAKVDHLYRAALTIGRTAVLSNHRLPRLPVRVDLVIVDRRTGRAVFRHLRALEPP